MRFHGQIHHWLSQHQTQLLRARYAPSRCPQLNPSPQDATAALPAALRSKLAKKGIGSEEASEPAVKEPEPATVSGASAGDSKWVKVVDEKSGHPYYHNTETNEVSWTKPEECSNTEEVR